VGLERKPALRLSELASQHRLTVAQAERLACLLLALAAEPAPPTTVTAPADAVDVHLADSLSGLVADDFPAAVNIADIGAGAGFPGLALALALPSAHVDLIEATGRKCETIERLAAAAGVSNAAAVHARAEEVASARPDAYDVVTARALAPLAVLVEYAAPLLVEGGCLIAWKGSLEDEEIVGGAHAAALLGLSPPEVVPVRPFPGARDRALVTLRKISPTPERFPRRPGVAAKRPLVS